MTEKTFKITTRTRASLVAALMLFPLGNAVASPSVVLAEIATLEKIRVADHGKYQRIVIDTSDAVTFKLVEGDGDLTLLVSSITSELLTRVWTDLGNVKGLKVKPVSYTSVHIIFDLAETMRPRISSYLPDSYGGHRTVIDLWPTTALLAEQHPMAEMQEAATSAPVSDADAIAARNVASVPLPSSDPGFVKASAQLDPEPDHNSDLETINQWPTQMDEAAQALVQQETATLFPEEGVEMDPDTGLGGDPDPDGTMSGLVVGDPIAIARKQMAKGSPDEACKVLQTNFPKGTWNIDAMLLQGECLRAIGKLIDANALYTEILSFEPDSFAARLGLAHIQVANSDFAAAKDNYTRALAKLPQGELADDTRHRLRQVEEALNNSVH